MFALSRRLGVAAAVLAGLALPASASAIGYAVTATSAPRLVSFDLAAPGSLLASIKLTGLEAGEVVQGMDLRPATGQLVLLTTSSGGAARLRTLDPGTGAVSAPIALAADPTDATAPYTTLTPGTGVGVDFNPISDRLRVVTGAGQDLRVNPANGLAITDGSLNPGTPEVTAAGYTNSFAGATTTTLYDVDLAPDALAFQNPPNNGTLVAVGPLGITPATGAGTSFDISVNGNAQYLVAPVGGVTSLYTVNPGTGQATAVGTVGDGATSLSGFAIANNVVRPSVDMVVASEKTGVALVNVTRLSPHLGMQVDYTTVNGSAIAGTDYDARSGTLIFAAGETSKTIAVPLHDDATVEPSKTFKVSLSNADPDAGTTATLPGPAGATLSIADDDGTPPSVTVPPDTVKPVLLATASEVKRSRLRSKGLRVRFSCSEACTVTAKLLAGKRTAAKKGTRLSKAGLGTVRLKPSKRGWRAIRARKRLKVAVSARDAAGNRSSYSFSVRVR